MKMLIDELLMLSQIDKTQNKIILVNINEVITEIRDEVKAAETKNEPRARPSRNTNYVSTLVSAVHSQKLEI